MDTKMKGLLKGLRQISNIFDAKDQEMQIGFPTDVKHVAHIGWDGSLVDASGPMNESQSTSLNQRPSQADSAINGGANASSPKDSLAKPSKCNSSSSNTPNAAEAETSGATKHPRRRQPRSDCPSQESSEGSRRGRRERKSSSSSGSDSSMTVQDNSVSGPTKQPRRKKATKGSTVRSLRSKEVAVDRAGPEQLPGPPLNPANAGAEGGL